MTESTHPLLAMAASVAIMILVIPLAIASGKAKGARLRELADDLKHGRLRGFAIIAVVVAVIAAVAATTALNSVSGGT